MHDWTNNALGEYRTVRMIVADKLREAILHGMLKGGQRLSQDEIAQQFCVSRMPVREALRQLESEGLVVFLPRRGATVAQLSPDDVQQLYEIRIYLELLAIRHAVDNFDKQTANSLHELLQKMEAEDDPLKWVALNRLFHMQILEPSHRPHLLSMIGTLRDNTERYMRIYFSVMGKRNESHQEHLELLSCCQQGNKDKAQQLLSAHLQKTADNLVEFLQSAQPPAGKSPAGD